jgi:hypothetical protein
MPEFDRLLLFRALRPDRLTAAMARYVANVLGAQYITSAPFELERSFQARARRMAVQRAIITACAPKISLHAR